jgi:hypothetical protein
LVENERSRLDGIMKQSLMPIASKIIEVSIPKNQIKRFPLNNLSLMTVSGAKGKNNCRKQ